jgi:Cys-tRNA(Pro) deacylase
VAKTAALRALEAASCEFEVCPYKYVEKGGTRASSQALGVDEHAVIKTLIFETGRGAPLIVLMHGDHQVSTKALARHMGEKSIVPCTPATAQKHSGYQVGGTSPFGTRKAMPVYMQETIAQLDLIYINGGKRGLLVKMDPKDLIVILEPELVEIYA